MGEPFLSLVSLFFVACGSVGWLARSNDLQATGVPQILGAVKFEGRPVPTVGPLDCRPFCALQALARVQGCKVFRKLKMSRLLALGGGESISLSLWRHGFWPSGAGGRGQNILPTQLQIR